MDKIFHSSTAPTESAAASSANAPSAASVGSAASAAPAGESVSTQNVDVGAVLGQMASRKGGGGGNY
jgi:hypothetical protein